MRKSGLDIAYHEAGHAVIARALGLEVTSVTIIPDLDLDTAGTCYAEWATYLAQYADLAAQLSAIEKDVVVTLAGPAAESQYLENREMTVLGGDLRNGKGLVQMALELSGRDHSEYDELFGQLSIEAEILVSQHWSAIERVAHGLLDFPTLNAADVDDLIAGTFLKTRTARRRRDVATRNAPQQAPVSTCRGFATRINVAASRSTAARSGSAAQAILKNTARVEEEEQRRL